MTHAPRPEHLATAARVAREEQVEITIETAGRVYRISPARQVDPEPADPFAARSLKK
jgi:hypothetical protein